MTYALRWGRVSHVLEYAGRKGAASPQIKQD